MGERAGSRVWRKYHFNLKWYFCTHFEVSEAGEIQRYWLYSDSAQFSFLASDNARSLRALLAAGLRPIDAECLFTA